LTSAVDYLVGRFGRPGTLDLRNAVIVVPGGRAGRRLLELLVQRAESESAVLVPPNIVTLGRLPELLYQAKRPFANDLVQQLAWAEVLHSSEPGRLGAILSKPPDETDFPAWLALGDMLSRLHRELAADALDFAAVADCGSSLPRFREAKRWQALGAIQADYLKRLDDLGLWDLQTARLVAIRNGECSTQAELVLLATADMNRADQRMLDQVADRVTALVVAPEEMADRFDQYGCLRPEAWRDVTMDLKPDQIEMVGGPADQAAAAVRAIASWGGRFAGEEITIGVPDAEIVPFLQQYLRQAEVPARYGAGAPVRQSAPCRLLEVVAEYLDGRRFSAWTALLRHPVVERWLADQGLEGPWLSELDEYYQEHLPYGVGDEWIGRKETSKGLPQVHRATEALLKSFAGSRSLGEWGGAILDLLVSVYGGATLDPATGPDRTILSAWESVQEALSDCRKVPSALAPSLSASEAIRLLLRQIEAAMVPALPVRGAVELLGWLELPLDDAPALVVTGFNEGRVPGSLNADLFLPNQLRLALGIEDNDRRYARDAYALSVLAASRSELKLIAGRRSADGTPLAPSRLLFACDAETAAARVAALFPGSDDRRPAVVLPGQLRPGIALLDYEPPQPKPLGREVTSMRVTEFGDFLACPYRYYLRHQLRLEASSDDGEELDGGAFGSLAHVVLRAFGESDSAACTDPEEISAWLSAALDREVRKAYGSGPLSAVAVQVEQLRVRLAAFARWQAAWAADGWRILRVEAEPDEPGAAFVVDGLPMHLRGRIDRIDVREASGELFLLDYKTGDRAKTPDEVHRKGDGWVDLQLPLYRHLLPAIGIPGTPRLGYVVLPKDTTEVGLLEASWSAEELESADRTAEEVIRKVRQESFWPPARPAPEYFEEYAAICGDGTFIAALAAASEEEGTDP
jgi:hypothetical protein